jgi:hypothetical protein
MVTDGRMPSAKIIDRRRVWDRCELDEYFESLPIDGAGCENLWDDVL